MPKSPLLAVMQTAAALAAAVLLAGCGSSAPSSPAAAAAAPTSSAGFDPALVSKANGHIPTPKPIKTPATYFVGSNNFVTLPKKVTAKPAVKATTTTKATATTPAKSATTTTPKTSSHTTTSAKGGSSTGSATVTIYRTVTVTVRPNVPADAHLPSIYKPLHETAFQTPGGNVGCRLGGGVVRCDIASTDWKAPAKPRSCTLAWGQGLIVGPTGSGHFVCAGDSVLDPGGPVISAGFDDRVGSVTCQIRLTGITCFSTSGDGFVLSRTGYATF